MTIEVVILAAGQGTRMKSARPKVLHEIAGRPMLAHVIATARALAPRAIHVVYGHGGEAVPQALPDAGVNWALQAEQLGTGHAVAMAMPAIGDDARVLILYGDVPLIERATLARLIECAGVDRLALLTARLSDPNGYGRIVRDAGGRVARIVEQKDANNAERAINEINTGVLAAPAVVLRRHIAALTNDNAQREYYLTDVIAKSVAEGMTVETTAPEAIEEILGVNDRFQLAYLERRYQQRIARRLMRDGVTLADPARLDVRGELDAARDVFIDVNVLIEGRVTLAEGVRIGAHCVLRDVMLGASVEVLPMSVIEGANIGAGARIGPFARIRPGTELANDVHIGNFVEIKQTQVDAGAKINHLSYVGDATIGKRVNIGAGTITCNYDGACKHRTVIEDDAFIGSDTQLVAPVTVGKGATLGAGTTLTRDAPPGELTLSRAKQQTISGWQRPVKKS
jgi:bifunctional UDP-N-acetylglucosamine pyrophosphorylase/glucosamine-1-phosphate N-acetyltransferase